MQTTAERAKISNLKKLIQDSPSEKVKRACRSILLEMQANRERPFFQAVGVIIGQLKLIDNQLTITIKDNTFSIFQSNKLKPKTSFFIYKIKQKLEAEPNRQLFAALRVYPHLVDKQKTLSFIFVGGKTYSSLESAHVANTDPDFILKGFLSKSNDFENSKLTLTVFRNDNTKHHPLVLPIVPGKVIIPSFLVADRFHFIEGRAVFKNGKYELCFFKHIPDENITDSIREKRNFISVN